MKIAFNKAKKVIKVECADVAFCTPFQPHVICEILNGIYELTGQAADTEFEYFKENGRWGFRAIPSKTVRNKAGVAVAKQGT